jgi:hypothetical protein
MGTLRVDVEGVRAMAERWHAHADTLSAGEAPPAGRSCQASALAVSAGHADVVTASAALTRRVHMTATKAGLADARYVQTEAESVKRMTALDPPPT